MTRRASAAIALWVRADWRRRWGPLIALALLTGLAFSVVATAFAGARRTATSFDRLRAETRAYDHGIVIDEPDQFPDHPERDRYDAVTVERVGRLPEIGRSAGLTVYVASLPDTDWEFALNAAEDDAMGSLVARDRLLRGRRPDAQRIDEVAINETTASRAHVDVGGVLQLETLTPQQRTQLVRGDQHAFDNGPLGPALRLKVVGVLRGPIPPSKDS